MDRSYLFAPGHVDKLVSKVFTAGADAVILDLEDAVPPQDKAHARRNVAVSTTTNAAWVRVNAVRSEDCAADLDAVGPAVAGIRIPKVDDPSDVEWVTTRRPGVPIMCAIETARGVLASADIAATPGCRFLAIGGVDLRRDLGAGAGFAPLQHARSQIVLAARAAGLPPPIDSVFAHIDDDAALTLEAEQSRDLGFFGKSAIHPMQLPAIHRVFTPTAQQIDWARAVLTAFDEAGHGALRMPDGEFVDAPVAARAADLLRAAEPPLSACRDH
ncbi:HpcH/HpaI aldolase/citrate lyase family protein [Mycolicibacterium fluoranthenivorans]|uniref:Citrate lyase subunit beta/citryl-CoA lyase n=1 Tax=Mycolicibacterium fluoranthenivorans TaxID=258505 RepID=A0A7X5ZCA8_9MYCO|nr:CoA ester lyase [Mycolicibacterium fluoranthenivorans]MCV7355887.1 CoA ester lyase [Mycolicibacterium fluoranthenivorans]NIH94886.1 citrate lyase subunit beta/citryl-CoA lyase [Mycolicibacterium fluoranthenivorans]